jgi:hypothetical protein
MRHPLQQYSRKIVILLLEALVIGALLAFAFFLKPENQPVQQPLPAQPRVAKIPSPPAMISDTATTVLELFNPSDQSLTHQLNETTIRQQIEQIMATNYVLANCHLIDAESYRNSFRALIVYAQRTKFADSWVTAEEKVRSITESASASYSLLYYRTKCDDPKLAQTTRQLIDWQNAYLDQ